MGVTPNFSLPYPELTDPADVPTDVHELATAVDSALTSADSRLDALEAALASLTSADSALDSRLDALEGAPDFKNCPGVWVTHSVDQSLAAGALRSVLFDTVRTDQSQGYTMWQSSTPQTLYAAAPGLHFFHFSVRWSADGSGTGTFRQLEVQRSGPSFSALPVGRSIIEPMAAFGGSQPTEQHVAGIVNLSAAAPWLQFFARHDATGNRSVLRVNEMSPVAGLVYLGPTLLT